ncbi:MAG: hypothetical protein JSR77_01735 [Planctomycetes bacterium]|nr:hypothetical protein [Planctomycetota bacterium]
MTVERKVAVLERRFLAGNKCFVCRGEGWAGFVLVAPSGKTSAPFCGCVGCGRSTTPKAYGSDGENTAALPGWIAAV